MEVAQGSRSSRAVLQTSGSARQEAGEGVELAELCLSQDISLPRGWVGSWAVGDERRGEGNLTGEESCLGTRPSPEIPKTNTCGASTGHRACHEARAVISLKRIHLAMQETQESQVRSLVQEDPLEKEMASHSSVLAWRIPRTEESGGLQSMESQRVRHD